MMEYFDHNILNGGINKNILFINKYNFTDCILPWQALSVKERINNKNQYNFEFVTDKFKDYILLYINNNKLLIYHNIKLQAKTLDQFLKYMNNGNEKEFRIMFSNYNFREYYNKRYRYSSEYQQNNKFMDLFKFDDDMLIDYYQTYINKLQLNTTELNNELYNLINDYNKACDEYLRYKLSNTQIKLDSLNDQFKDNSLEDSVLYKEEI